jgi:small subunit ribosomal protein S8
MVVNDPIGDMLIRIKNGYLARKDVVEVPYSKMKEEIAKILVKEGYLKKFKIENLKFKILKLELKYEGKKPVIEGIKRISKPGVRIYAKAKEIPRVKYGFGITIVSTPKGIMTDRQARKENLGGEVICQIW